MAIPKSFSPGEFPVVVPKLTWKQRPGAEATAPGGLAGASSAVLTAEFPRYQVVRDSLDVERPGGPAAVVGEKA